MIYFDYIKIHVIRKEVNNVVMYNNTSMKCILCIISTFHPPMAVLGTILTHGCKIVILIICNN